MAFRGEKIEKFLADFTAFHVLHPSLITLQLAASKHTGQDAHHTIRHAGLATALEAGCIHDLSPAQENVPCEHL
jgi:hypothetical protein